MVSISVVEEYRASKSTLQYSEVTLPTLQANQHLRALKQAIQAPSNKLYK